MIKGFINSAAVLLLLFSVLFPPASLSNNKPISVAVNLGSPWAYYEEGKGITGIDVEIIKRILSGLGYQPKFHLLAYNRLIEQYNQGIHDIASPAAFEFKNGTLTDKYLPFEDVAISLKENKLEINTIDDLVGKKIIAYQHAKSVLGEEFAKITTQANYEEMGLRELQVKLLVNNRVDVIIGERRVINFIINKLYPEKEITVHHLFPIVHYGGVIRDKTLAAKFNQSLNKMIASGEYQNILQAW
ncbi:substrate-binding periplasmic protein [Thalassotalea sediminis]|uniref:substrate-binding periplasmic protein n=1 Tax=Thalassotalea sediminis TaxID=1759089 RepID=UPI002573E986|nr:transporter substrate-binding domain-containing protein [Thalassotalea sediminis]